jgi:hypothetical protein
MGHPKQPQKGVVDGKFKKRIEELEKKARKFADHFRNHNTYREWHVPPEFKDPLDVPSLHVPAWERNDINQKYSEEIVGHRDDASGSDGDAKAMKLQADFMAVEERAFRTRHASMIRSASFLHGRLDGHGQQSLSLFSYLKDSIQTLIDKGAKSR